MRFERRAVVLSSDVIGLGAVRSLARAGVPTIAVTLNRFEPVRFSRYAEKRPVPRSEDQDAAILEVLAGIEESPPPVLLPTSDYLAHFLARHRAELAGRFVSCIPSDDVMELVLDKSRDTRLLQEWELPLPRSVQLLPRTPAELVRRLGLPLIIKPRTYEDKRELGWRNVVAHRIEHVEEFYRSQREVFGRVIGQELIPGGDDALWECICVFDANSDLASAFTFRKLRTVPAHYGQTSHGRSERNEEIIELARTLGKRLGYVGPADFDLKYDHRDGQYKYLELNPRLGLCNEFATRSGVNLALAAYCVASGNAPPRPAQREGVTFLAALEDAGGRLYDGDGPGRVLVDLLRALARHPVGAYFAWDDPLPGPFAAVRLAYRFVQEAWRGRLASIFTKDYRKLPDRSAGAEAPSAGIRVSDPRHRPPTGLTSTPAAPPARSG
jgi:predicted ATP-grasp superfamily ATP-dependent carboligase